MTPAPVHIAVRGVSHVFRSRDRDVVALESIDLEIARGELCCLLGPSGCGKSTLLSAIAGFVRPSAGVIVVDGQPVSAPGPERGMVFQEYALFPWMTVADNIAFGLTVKRWPRARVTARTDELLSMFGLREFAGRFPKDLSGGMRQRVAIARVLALDPPILLMDEPFGALDALTRRNLQDELLRVWAALGKTIVFVTHSLEEAIHLADRVVVMTHRPGRIKRDERITIARPRDPASPGFNACKAILSDLVMEEQARLRAAELTGA